VRQTALALGWPKSTYAGYEEVFAKPHLPARLAGELVPVLEFFGVHRSFSADLFETGCQLDAEAIPPLVATLKPGSQQDALRIQTLQEIKARRRRPRVLLNSLVPAHLMDFEASARYQEQPPAEPPPPQAPRPPINLPGWPVTMDVMKSRSLGDGILQIDFDDPIPGDAPFFMRGYTGLYCLIVEDQEAIPGHKIGEKLLAAQSPIKAGDLVIVTYRVDDKSIGSCSIFAVAVTLNDDYIEVARFMKQGTTVIRRDAIQRVDRVLTKDELQGGGQSDKVRK